MTTLLIVDDYPPGLAALELLLESHEYSIVTARSGAEALQVLAAIDVSLIVTDERMDDVCGSELAQRVRGGARNCDVPIVLLSGADPAEDGIRRAIALPDVIFVAKPIHGPWLRARVAELVRGERGAAEVLARSR